MATSRRPESADEDEIPSAPKGSASIHDRIAAFAMLDGMIGKTQAEKCMRLKLIGFGNGDIAQMLQTTPAVVASNVYAERKKAAKKPATRKATSAGDGAAA
jgi:hypothetical protein